MTPHRLADFRTSVPACELAVYADIATRTVLLADGALRYPQEYLDALCECAAQLFEGGIDFDGDPIDPIVFFGPTGGRVFLRAPEEQGEALCCICGADADVTALLAAGRAALAN
ncbi:MAG: hypothetical protein AAF914_14270 [Pseudomonadota bacterium]